MGMEAVGSLGFPIPRPVLHQPRPVPRVAQGLLEAVLVELTRPVEGAFAVRIFDEGVRPPAAEVAAVVILYGAEVAAIGRRLEQAWRELELEPTAAVRYVCYRAYDHPCGYAEVLRTVEALQESYLP
jgi:hypothetical protein